MGMKTQSSKETRSRAKELSEAIGSYHVNTDIDEIFHAQRNLIGNTLNFEPQFKVHGGSVAENVSSFRVQLVSNRHTKSPPDNVAKYPGPEPHGNGILLRSDPANGP